MSTKRRVFVSVPTDGNLDERQRDLKQALLEKVSAAGYEPQIFFYSGMAAGLAWNFPSALEVMRCCQGAMIVGFPRWKFETENGELQFPTEYNHYEGALANALGLPILTIAERGIVDRGIHWTGGGNPILFAPPDADRSWLEHESFRQRFDVWVEQLESRYDVFLGYCGEEKATAQALHLFLTNRLGLRVLDWAMDFAGGATILDELERAVQLCSCAIFLFSRDDLLEGSESRAAPRDNVIFEAGYFVQAKGKERVLIIREEGAKMPADVGGNIYATLPENKEVASIEGVIRDFVDRRL